jgi:hypothetical protein
VSRLATHDIQVPESRSSAFTPPLEYRRDPKPHAAIMSARKHRVTYSAGNDDRLVGLAVFRYVSLCHVGVMLGRGGCISSEWMESGLLMIFKLSGRFYECLQRLFSRF